MKDPKTDVQKKGKCSSTQRDNLVKGGAYNNMVGSKAATLFLPLIEAGIFAFEFWFLSSHFRLQLPL